MPGCTVPRCSNSTQKGFKLFHFPSDSERCALWVKNCGREEGWEPTRHTCICEVHFEESQFELHRADGLRKLKPYAVPTLFSDAIPTFCRRRKKSNSENDNTNLKPGLQEDTKQRKNDKNNITMSIDVSPSISKNTNRSLGLQTNSRQRNNYKNTTTMSIDVLPSVSKNTNRKPGLQKNSSQRKNDKNVTMSRDVSPRVSNKPEIETNIEKDKSEEKDRNVSTEWFSNPRTEHISRINNRKPLSNDGKTTESKKEMEKHASLLSKDYSNYVSQASDSENEARDPSQSKSEANACFICNSRSQNIVPNNAYTETSKTQLKQKLVQLVAVEFDLLVQDIDTICINCAQILNCIDYVENIHYTLSKGILNHVKKKFCMGPTEHVNLELCMKSLKNLTDFYPWKDVDESHLIQKQKENGLVTSEAQHDHESDKSSEIANQFSEIENEDHNVENQEIILRENIEENTTTVNNFECEICSYETKYKAFMIFHLRQHFQKHYTCDFCSTPVAYDPSPAKEMQTSDASCKIRGYSKCKSDKPNKVPPPRFSEPQTDYQQHKRDSLEKRNMGISRKRKSVNAQESHKSVKRTNISNKFEDDSSHLILNSKEKQKNLL